MMEASDYVAPKGSDDASEAQFDGFPLRYYHDATYLVCVCRGEGERGGGMGEGYALVCVWHYMHVCMRVCMIACIM